MITDEDGTEQGLAEFLGVEPEKSEWVNEETRAIPLPTGRRAKLRSREDIDFLLKQKLEDLEMWVSLRNRYGFESLLIQSINTDLLLLGRSEQTIPDPGWGLE